MGGSEKIGECDSREKTNLVAGRYWRSKELRSFVFIHSSKKRNRDEVLIISPKFGSEPLFAIGHADMEFLYLFSILVELSKTLTLAIKEDG